MDRLERLLNLVIALRETRRPLTAGEIRERVAGYDQPDHAAFRRMFERDKADLRALGVPVETAALDAWGDTVGYRIDPRRYDLPDLDLEPDELAALAVAVEAAGLGDTGGGGVRKLAVGSGADAPRPGAAGAPRLGVGLAAPHLDVLAEAQVSRTPVRFAYRKAGTHEAQPRAVDPHALVHRRGRWYLVGRDHERDERRAFRLDRIEAPVRPAGDPGTFDPPDEQVGVDDVVPAGRAPHDEPARVAAAPDVAWQVARAARGGGDRRDDGWTVYEVAVTDRARFVGWVLSFAPDVEVLEPAALRRALHDVVSELAEGRA